MRKYIAKLHKKPDHHKKRFAFLFSATFTMAIFGVWSLVMFGPSRQGTLVERPNQMVEEDKANNPTPLGNLFSGMAATIQAIRGDIGEVVEGLQTVDVESEYQGMKHNAIEIYERQ
jgi:hypothetical protein